MMCIQKNAIKYRVLRQALALIAVYALTVEADIPTGANRLEHAKLCAVIALASAKLEIPEETQMDAESYETIQSLNASTASGEWKNGFSKDVDMSKLKAAATHYSGTSGTEGKNWVTGTKASDGIRNSDREQQLRKQKTEDLKTDPRSVARKKVARLAQEAEKLRRKAANAKAEAINITANDEHEKLKRALLGKTTGEPNSATPKEAFGGKEPQQRSTACAVTGQQGSAITAPAQLACICTKGDPNHVTAACTPAADGATGWGPSAPELGKNDIQKTVETCPSGKETNITAQLLRQIISGVQELVHIVGGDGYIGAYKTSDCNGKKDSGVCVKLDQYNENPRQSFDKLGWPPVLQALANKLENRLSHNKQVKEINSALQKAKEEAIVAIREAEAETDQQHHNTQDKHGADPETVSKELENKKKECDHHKDNKAACENAKCKWEGKYDTEGKCIVDESKVKEQTSTSAAAGKGTAEAEKCKGKLEDACTKDPSCKWENNTCKDSSILVNNQFALSMVSAAFVALLF